MVRCARSSLGSADIVVLIIDSSTGLNDMMREIVKKISALDKKIIFLMNKIDLKSKYFIDNIGFLNTTAPKSRIFNISALSGKGIDDFLQYLRENATNPGWMYEEDDITNLPARFLASEITREQLFLQLNQELPYSLAMEYENWEEQKDGSVKISQAIIVTKDSHKNIVIGRNGNRIRAIGMISRKNIEKLLGRKVHLFLFVKLRKHWEDNAEFYNMVGI